MQAVAKRYGIRKGFMTGLASGLTGYTLFVLYAVCLWFGAWLVRNEIRNDWYVFQVVNLA